MTSATLSPPTAARPALLIAVLVLTFLWSGAGTAAAHTELTGSTPTAGSTVTTAPAELTLTFTEPVQDFVPTVTVTGPDGRDYADGAPVLSDTTLTQRITTLGPPGAYTTAYRIVSADDHPVSGDITFTYTPPDPTTSPASPSPSPTSDATDPATSPTASAAALSPAASDSAVSSATPSPAAASGDTGSSDSGAWHWTWFALLGAAVLALIVIPVITRAPRAPR